MGLFTKKEDSPAKMEKTVEEFMMLIRVYYQVVIAMNLGVTNLNIMPDMALFKRMLKIPTQQNKLGLGEKNAVKKILMADYGLNENFFKEIDASIKKNCKTQQHIQPYFFKFQGFNNELFTLLDGLMKWKFRLSMLFKKALKKQTAKVVNEIMTRSEWDNVEEQKKAWSVRKYAETMGYSEAWVSDLVYTMMVLARDNARKSARKKKEDQS